MSDTRFGPPPMKCPAQCCARCVYAQRPVGRWREAVMKRWPGTMICHFRDGARGEFTMVSDVYRCANFFRKRSRTVRGRPPEPPNDEVRYIPLTKGKYAIVDACDYERLNKHKWFAQQSRDGKRWYACRGHRGALIFMHREIMNPPPDMVVDHIEFAGPFAKPNFPEEAGGQVVSDQHSEPMSGQ
jgi:hypothetical protein